MTTRASDPVESLLSRRARIGWGVSVATPRPSMSALYEFGGGYPDPVSFPYEGMVEATADRMQAEGAAAMTYGEPQGYGPAPRPERDGRADAAGARRVGVCPGSRQRTAVIACRSGLASRSQQLGE